MSDTILEAIQLAKLSQNQTLPSSLLSDSRIITPTYRSSPRYFYSILHIPNDNATRAQALALKVMGIRSAEIQEITGIQHRTLQALFRKAKERGYDPDTSKKILDIHVKDAPRSGRPTKQTPEVVENVISKMDRRGREKTCTEIAREVGGISDTTVWRILRKAGYNKTKPTRKPGLTEEMKKARLQFALDHKDWTFEDWKKVIWSDETSIVIGHRRGGYRIWRRAEERWNKSCIRPRWKGYTEFQFWGCFSYDKRGPCHIWKPETAAQQKAATKKIEELNMELEPVLRAERELKHFHGALRA